MYDLLIDILFGYFRISVGGGEQSHIRTVGTQGSYGRTECCSGGSSLKEACG